MSTRDDSNRPLQIEQTLLALLKPQPGNPRIHSEKQIRQIADSINTFGFVGAILIDHQYQIIAGHGRAEAAKLLGMKTVPTIRVDGWSDAKIRAYVITDNRLAERSGWDRKLLAVEFNYLINVDWGFEITTTGFEPAEIDVILNEQLNPDDAEVVEQLSMLGTPETAVTRPGDLWQVGEHRLYCGDATEEESYQKLLGDARAGMVFMDPPYNVRIAGHVSGLGAVSHREFAMASGEMSSAEFEGFLLAPFKLAAKFSINGSIHYICMDWRHLREILAAGCAAYSELKNLCVWKKSAGGMGSLYRSEHELVFVFKSGTAPHVNNVELGKNGRTRTNVWSYPGLNSFGKDRDEMLAMHPTVKPVALVADAILDCSRRKTIILDPFAGSGTTLVAAHRTGRRGYGIELDPCYCDLILGRVSRITGEKPVLSATGLTFADVETQRTPTGAAAATQAPVPTTKSRSREPAREASAIQPIFPKR